jgi:hypothetical protein
MHPDVRSGRTELSNYNGYLMGLSGKTPCPYNAKIVALFERITQGQLRPAPALLEELY